METCFFTGHRILAKNDLKFLIQRTNLAIRDYIFNGCTTFKTGGALGFDTVASFSVIFMRRIYPHIKLVLVLPCIDQAELWNLSDQKRYEYIKDNSDQIIYVSDYYHKGCMKKRNEQLVNGSDSCICYFKGTKGGTSQTLEMAKAADIEIVNVCSSKRMVME